MIHYQKKNLDKTLEIINEIRLLFPQKSIWIYSGYTWEEIFSKHYDKDYIVTTYPEKYQIYRQQIIKNCDVLIDGRYIDLQRDITLNWRGSSNQKVIDIQKSLQEGEIALWSN